MEILKLAQHSDSQFKPTTCIVLKKCNSALTIKKEERKKRKKKKEEELQVLKQFSDMQIEGLNQTGTVNML